jgi:Flp pilus assembly protein TadG
MFNNRYPDGFVRNISGSFMVLTALTMSVLMGFTGLAVDIGRTTNIKESVQAAVDAGSGACAATWLITKDASKAEDAARRFLTANLDPSYSGGLLGTQNGLQVKFNQGTESCDISIEGDVPTTFSAVLGSKKLSLTNVSSSQIKGSSRMTKLVLIMDKSGFNNTFNMTCSPAVFQQIKTSAQDTVDRFFTFRQSNGNSFLGTVFYNSTVANSDLESSPGAAKDSISNAVAEVCAWGDVFNQVLPEGKKFACTTQYAQEIYGNSKIKRPGTMDLWDNCHNNSLGAMMKADEMLKEDVPGQKDALEVLEIGVLLVTMYPTHDENGKYSNNIQQNKDDMIKACDDFKRAGVARTTNKTKVFRLLYTVIYHPGASGPAFDFARKCASYPEMSYEPDPARGVWDIPNILNKISTEIRLIMDGAQMIR